VSFEAEKIRQLPNPEMKLPTRRLPTEAPENFQPSRLDAVVPGRNMLPMKSVNVTDVKLAPAFVVSG
jgi:hypothetical protein